MLSIEEKRIIETGKAQGKTREQIINDIQISRGITKKTEAPIAPVATIEQREGPSSTGFRELGQLATGAGKGLASTVTGATQLGLKTIGRLGQAIGGGIGELFGGKKVEIVQRAEESLERIREGLEPKEGLEKAGFVAEQLTEFIVPFGKITALTKGKALLTRVFAEGVAGGTIGGGQEGELSSVRDTAIIAAIFPVAGKVFGSIKGRIKDLAPRVINSLIKPLKKEVSFGKNPGRAVSEEGIVASSLDDLERKIDDVLDKRVKELNKLTKDSKEVFDVTNVLKPLDDAMDVATKQNNQALLTRLQNTREALSNELLRSTDDAGRELISVGKARKTTGLSAEETIQFKRDVGSITAFTGNPSDDKLVNSALQSVYRNLKGMLDEAIPNSRELNERIADLISAKVATKYRAEIAERGNLIKLTPKIIGTGGFLASIATGNPLPVILSLGAIGVEKVLETPRAKTEFAKWLASSSKEQKRELFQKAPFIKAIILETFLGVSR